MRSPNELFEELEEGRASRESEIRLLQNLAELEVNELRQAALRRSLVLITYAHFEGFSQFAMESYASAVNSAKISCSEAVPPLVAITLHSVFMALRHPQSKHPAFSAQLPHDSDLHMAWREHQFVEKLGPLMSTTVEIPDGAIDTESNLKPAVLKRNMYRLGLNFDALEKHSGQISMLLGKRNQISHGELVNPTKEDTDGYVYTAFEVMSYVQSEVYEALVRQSYKKAAA